MVFRWELPSPACTAAVPTQLCHFLPGTLPLRLRVGTETLLLRRATPFLSSLGQVFVNKLLELCRNEWKDLGLSVYSLQLWNNRCWFAFHLKYSLEGKHWVRNASFGTPGTRSGTCWKLLVKFQLTVNSPWMEMWRHRLNSPIWNIWDCRGFRFRILIWLHTRMYLVCVHTFMWVCAHIRTWV